jgi:hypothetical protein
VEIRFIVDDSFLKSLQEKLGMQNSTEVVKSALTLLNWAVDEVSKGRVILSSNEVGGDVHRLFMPALEAVKRPESTPSIPG